MNFKIYDIVSLLIPGFIILFVIIHSFDFTFNDDSIIFSTAIAFVLGFIINTLSSWLEGLYFLTWGGKPSDKILDGKDIWKVKFYKGKEVREFLLKETINESPSNDELFSIALCYVNEKDSRIENTSAYYSFSRSLLTTVLISSIIIIPSDDFNLNYYYILIPLIFIIWLRCKQRGYYYVREVLTEYMQKKDNFIQPSPGRS